MTNIQGQIFFTVPLNPAKRQPQLASWCFHIRSGYKEVHQKPIALSITENLVNMQ